MTVPVSDAAFALQYAPTGYSYWFGATAVATLVLAVAVLGNREQRLALVLAAMLATTSVWCLTYGLQLASATVGTARLWNDVRLLCSPVVSVFVFLFAAEYTGHEAWLRRRRAVLLFAVPAVTAGLIATNDAHHLVRGAMIRSTEGAFVGATIGPWRLAYGLWDYLLVGAAIVMLLAAMRRRERIYRSQVVTVVAGVAVTTAANVAWAFGLFAVDPSPFGFAVGGLLFAVALYRYRLLDISPIARSTVFDTVDAGVLVVDRDGRVVDANESAGNLLDAGADSFVGRDVASLVEGQLPPAFVERLRADREFRERVERTAAGASRWYDVIVSSIHDDTSRYLGRLVMITDITDRERRRRTLAARTQELERQNDHLERVTSFVSHDLRNPLTVAHGRLELAKENDDPEHLDVVADSLDRMDRLVDQMLEMARQGRAVTETEPVDVAAVATDAWRVVETGDATLDVAIDRTVDADRDRLLQVFENLFRNAVEHGSTSQDPSAPEDAEERGETEAVAAGTDATGTDAAGTDAADPDAADSDASDRLTVRVGAVDAGFFVEDSGPGIPPDRRDEVFEQGYTTGEAGVGLGLAIVQSAVRAHGWSVSVETGTDGGARFVIATERPAETDQLAETDLSAETEGRGETGRPADELLR